jgi:hypothetical protein
MSAHAANEHLDEVLVEIRHRAAGIRDELFERVAPPGDDEGAPLCGRGVPSPGGAERPSAWDRWLSSSFYSSSSYEGGTARDEHGHLDLSRG